MNSVVECIYIHSLQDPDKLAVVTENEKVTYAELWKMIRTAAMRIREKGVTVGDRVMLEAPSDAAYLACCYGTELLGAISVPYEKKSPDDRIREIAEDIKPSVILRDSDERDTIEGYSDNDASAGLNDFSFPTPELVAEILYTTGTTGKSKGVMVTHYAQMNMCNSQNPVIGLKKDNVWLIPTPMNHAAGLRKTHMSMVRGSTVNLLQGFTDLKKFFGAIKNNRVTSLYLPPAGVHYVLLLAAKELAKYDDQLDFIYSSSSALPSGDKEKLIELLPHVRKYDAYGGSEVGAVCYIDYNSIRNAAQCVGKPNEGVDIFFVDENYCSFHADRENPGIIAIKSNTVTAGYWNEPELTRKTIHDGVIYMSDLGYMDDEGFLYLVGRRDDVINVGGFKVAPTEVEDVALRLPMVDDCVCIPFNDKINGQVLKLLVVIKEGSQFDPIRMASMIGEKLEAYKVPKYIELIDAIPRTFNGKIDRKAIIASQNKLNA